MDALRHAHLARLLIAACGGVDEITSAEPAFCRVGRTQLFDYGNDNKADAFMPADVIAQLEEYCGEPIYSRALVENRPSVVLAKTLLTEACETTEMAAQLQHLVRTALADDRLTPKERRKIQHQISGLEQQIREARAALEGATA